MVPFGYGLVQFECCPSSVPIPTTACEPKKLGGECLEDGIWKSRAAVVCGQSGERSPGRARVVAAESDGQRELRLTAAAIPCMPSS
jgi:hypothetical protein